MKILGLGSIAIDRIFTVDRLPVKDGFSNIIDEKIYDGGSCANVINQIAMYGGDTAFCAKIGDDESSKIIKKGLEKSGINSKYMITKENGISTSTIIYVDKNGDKSILTRLGDCLLNLTKDEINKKIFEEFDILYTDFIPSDACLYAAKEFKKRGKTVVFNLQVAPIVMKGFGMTDEIFSELFNYIDVFNISFSTLKDITGLSNLNENIDFIRENYKYNGDIILTLGSKGACVCTTDDLIMKPSLKIESVDTTGAGDSFIGTFLYWHYVRNENFEQSLRYSNTAAAITCTRKGARSGPDLNELIYRIKEGF
jgi:sugar/nucleoside kinase (ribokinase family)